MKKIYALIVFTWFCFTLGFTQAYVFSVHQEAYQELSGSTSLTNNLTWDDPYYDLSLGFTFPFFDTTLTHLYSDESLGGSFISDTSYLGLVAIIAPFEADLIDRGYDFMTGDGGNTSLSNISYVLEGNTGNHILKIEWKNAGFYSELSDDQVSDDYINFQFWLYEANGNMEIRFGSNSVANPTLCYDDESGPIIAFVPKFDYFSEISLIPGMYLSGNTINPNLVFSSDIESFEYLNGTPTEGTVYRFVRNTSSVDDLNSITNVELVPNPARNVVAVQAEVVNRLFEVVSVFNAQGQLVKVYKDVNKYLDVSMLKSGVYQLKLQSGKDCIVKSLIIQ